MQQLMSMIGWRFRIEEGCMAPSAVRIAHVGFLVGSLRSGHSNAVKNTYTRQLRDSRTVMITNDFGFVS